MYVYTPGNSFNSRELKEQFFSMRDKSAVPNAKSATNGEEYDIHLLLKIVLSSYIVIYCIVKI